MSAAAAHESQLQALSETLRRELSTARAEVAALAAQRQAAERALRAAVDAERSALRALSALEAVVREAAGVAPGLTELAPADERLRGVHLREMIARVALRRDRVGESIHWRTWHSWLREEGFDAVGRKPEATFLTQLSRSPLVRRTAQDGVYVLDLSRVADERERLRQLHEQLAQLPPPEQLGLLGDVRERRRALQNAIARCERAVEEMWRVLAQERPPTLAHEAELVAEHAVEAWLRTAVG